MKKFGFYFLILVILACGSSTEKGGVAQVKTIELNIDPESVSAKGGDVTYLHLVPVDGTIAIGQFGRVDLMTIDYTTGKEIDRIDMNRVADLVDAKVKSIFGNEYYVPSEKEYLKRGISAGSMPYTLSKSLYHPEEEKYVVNIRYVVFNKDNVEDQQLVDVMLLFNEHFENLEVNPRDYINRGPVSAGLNTGGFFLSPNRFFAHLFSLSHRESFDFVEYDLVDNSYYKLVDTLHGITTSKTGHGARFFTTFSIEDENFLNLGTGLHQFNGSEIRLGEYHPFPLDSNYSCLFIEPFDDNWMVGYFVNDYSNEPEAIGKLVLLDKDFESHEIIEEFDLTEDRFSTFFVFDNVISLINYNFEDERFYLTKYSKIH